MPNADLWLEALTPSLIRLPTPALAAMRPFAGAVYLVQSPSHPQALQLSTDVNGYSVALRMAMYTTRLLSEERFSLLPVATQVEVLYMLSLTAGIIVDELDLSVNNLCFNVHQNPNVPNEIREFVLQFQTCLATITGNSRSWRRNLGDAILDHHDSSLVMHQLIFRLVEECSAKSSSAYYSSKALCHLMSTLVGIHGWQSEGGEDWLIKLDILKASTTNLLGATAILIGIGENLSASKHINIFCNRLFSEVAGISTPSEKTTQLLVLLNAVLCVYEETDLPVASHRLVLAVKNILGWTPDLVSTRNQLSSEVCYALQRILPAIKEVYGPYWETTLSLCRSIWLSCSDDLSLDECLPVIAMSLKLYAVLRGLKHANDDLDEALAEFEKEIFEVLVKLLKMPRLKPSQPLEYVDELLSRLIVGLPAESVTEYTEFYPLVASDFRKVQSTAFDILHKLLPNAQQQISVDVALEKRGKLLYEPFIYFIAKIW